MEKYNYYDAVKEDIKYVLPNYYSDEELQERLEDDRDSLIEELNDNLWTDDSVTGYGSGSYTFDRYKASEYLVGNYGLLQEALEEFGYDSLPIDKLEPEFFDVTIRCYLLKQCIEDVLG